MSAPTIAIIGAGPAGVYAADLLLRDAPDAEVDLYERLPAPYGLVRYGVSPDHPRIKKIQDALHEVLEHPRIRVLCNVEIGTDVTLEALRDAYDAVIIATGASQDRPLGIPGEALPGSHGGAEFVSWYDGHPDGPRTWPLDAESIAVIGAGNVALDVARMLVSSADDLAHTDIPGPVADAFANNRVRDLHLLIRRGPADVRFSPLELRELGARQGVDMIVDPSVLELDAHAERMVAQFTQRRILVRTFQEWAAVDPASRTAPRRVHFHFAEQPVRLLGEDRVRGIETERTAPDALGRFSGTGERVVREVDAVYRTIGYRSSPLPGAPFDDGSCTIPERAGRVLDPQGAPVPGLYTTGWVRRGPVGLIGSTKSDASETITSLREDLESLAATTAAARASALRMSLAHAVDWAGWLRIDAAERRLGSRLGRERTKIVDREVLVSHAREQEHTR